MGGGRGGTQIGKKGKINMIDQDIFYIPVALDNVTFLSVFTFSHQQKRYKCDHTTYQNCPLNFVIPFPQIIKGPK
jgi:hypothetical protein